MPTDEKTAILEFQDAQPRDGNDEEGDEDLPIQVQPERRGEDEPYPKVVAGVQREVVDQTPASDAVARGDPPTRQVEEILPLYRVREGGGGAGLLVLYLHWKNIIATLKK